MARLESYLRAWPRSVERFLEANAPADHPFEEDPGSLIGVPWCLVYDANGYQCRIRQMAHPMRHQPPAAGQEVRG